MFCRAFAVFVDGAGNDATAVLISERLLFAFDPELRVRRATSEAHLAAASRAQKHIAGAEVPRRFTHCAHGQ